MKPHGRRFWLAIEVAALGCVLQGCVRTPVRHAQESQRTALGLYMRGLMLERTAHLTDALDAYQHALEHDYESPALAVRIGATHVKLGQADAALKQFSRALTLNPADPDALRWIAMLETSQGHIEEAMDAYQRLLKQQPSDRFVLSTLADLYLMQGDLAKAAQLYDQMIREDGSTAQLHFNLGIIYGRMGRLSDSIQELSRALELSPEAMDIRVALALTYELNGQPEKALAHYEGASTQDPLNPKLYLHLARAYTELDRYQEAADNYRTALDLVPDDMEAIMGLVRLWMVQKRFDDAQQLLAKKLQTANQTTDLYLLLGLLYREANVPYEAVRAFEQAVAERDDSPQAHFYLGGQLERLNRKAEARLAFRRTLELDPNYADALNYLGYMDAEDGVNLHGAKAMIERALLVDPDNGAYVDSLGWVCYQMGDVDQAIMHLERASQLLDIDPSIFDHLGDAYVKRGDMQRAQAAWEKALSLDPTLDAVKQKLERIRAERASAPTSHDP